MKLVYCPKCDDVFRLIGAEWRLCKCGRSGGRYASDNVTGLIGGQARVFGISNVFFMPEFPKMTGKQIKALHKEYGYEEQRCECWWGEFEGDVQIERYESAFGPETFVHQNNKRPLWWAWQALRGKVNFEALVHNLQLLSDEVKAVARENRELRRMLSVREESK